MNGVTIHRHENGWALSFYKKAEGDPARVVTYVAESFEGLVELVKTHVKDVK